ASFDGIPYLGGYRNNPIFKPEQSSNSINQYITQIDVEVYYYGKLDVILDWVKIETPRAKQISYGACDTEVSDAVDLTISDLKTKNNYYNPRLFGFYGPDEIYPNQWAVTRYFNMLLDTLATLETFTHYENDPPHYLHATGMKRFWNGSNMNFLTICPVPFFRKTSSGATPQTLNYSFGYAGHKDLDFDTLSSQFETYLHGT
nr:hypothetical protein [Candidatus Kapabacteria bacterium]